MNGLAVAFTVTNVIVLFFLPRRWAPLPLLVGACYMTLGEGLEVGPFHFTAIRILIFAGFLRTVLRGERFAGRMNTIDRLMLIWSVWALLSSVFHEDLSAALVYRLGQVYNACGIYFLLRIFCRSLDEVIGLCRITAILLIPVAAEMVFEKLTCHNLFSAMGGISEVPEIREGKIRAQGPFAHSILAGTVGAVCLPLMIALWSRYRKEAFIGIGACSVMILAATSSGPIMSAIAAFGALWMWRYRHRMRLIRRLVVLSFIGLDLVMHAPAYYLIARIDLVGGSTGWYRARLIEAAFQRINEWWLGGTDSTRNWMVSGTSLSAVSTDITNHYLQMGVVGGLPLMALFIVLLIVGFSFVGKTLWHHNLEPKFQFMVWALGAALFAHAVTFLSVSYFDQSFLFLYLTLATIGSAWSATTTLREKQVLALAHEDKPYEGKLRKLKI